MNPTILKFDEYLLSNFENKIFTTKDLGNVLNEINEIKKTMVPHLRYSLLTGEQRKNYIEKTSSKEKVIKKCKKN